MYCVDLSSPVGPGADHIGVRQDPKMLGDGLAADPQIARHRTGVVRLIGQPHDDLPAGPIAERQEDVVGVGSEKAGESSNRRGRPRILAG